MEQTPARLMALPSWLLTQTATHTHRLVQEELARSGARGHHYRVLATLEEFGPASQATVGRHAGVHLSDVVAALNELAELDLVERAPDPQDRRRNVITITPAGRRQLKKLDKRLAEAQEELLAPLSPEEREQFTQVLARLLSHHER
ncbi:MarR family winged helix-turn-helix transcriptional regulator [Allokutzneria sp. NRRL B-24872]|uniref:MarR family winged helix-turn-helix transcriptional regulator n=1 Tax=Allokutzneria sp. NRRL B-24872 TaxID=1137961 RepID=UPI000A39930E|nr:MarR family transcriptional regulator [Allokutzneria sp. NRRL B-24872]